MRSGHLNLLTFLLSTTLLFGCASAPKGPHEPAPVITEPPRPIREAGIAAQSTPMEVPSGIADLQRQTQDAKAYLCADTAQHPLLSPERQADLDTHYNKLFFAPWRQKSASVPASTAFRTASSSSARKGFAENLQPIDPQRWEELVAMLQRDLYPLLKRPAITTRNTALRTMPTSRPLFHDPALAGEGFPFDYLQASALWSGTALFVTHQTTDGAWLYAETGFASGWIPTQDTAWASEAFRRQYETGTYAALVRDGVSLRDEQGNFLTRSHLGAIFPLSTPDGQNSRILVPVRDAEGNAQIRLSPLVATDAAPKPLPLSPAGIAELANRLMGQAYGWGGMYENRDCSATLRDLFAPFGIWLPRHSSHQAKGSGSFLDLEGRQPDQKITTLLEQGVPFYTLIWLKGHIGLYLGPDPQSGEPRLLHNLWGVKTLDETGREGRALLGRLAITSLRPGEERPDVQQGAFIEKILGLTILPGGMPR